MGPGTEFKKLVASLGIVDMCATCIALMRKMDELGVAGCIEWRDELITELEESAQKYGWRKRIHAAGKAILKGLAGKVNPFNPIPGLFDEAIRLASVPPK